MKVIKSIKLQDLDNSLFDEFKKEELDNLVAVVGGRGVSTNNGKDETTKCDCPDPGGVEIKVLA